ncbi:hypothetical protein KUTeg_004778 [Tegillarca granosa]|uniref:Uncharacterized protein n=1 Tax=Tegillarca granosa TaxID=220873 RepID=A0ABQ9FHX6_TEGGR|nr:hypothetical protein KUTeg_004778 [Tegillarca granosa]
MFGFFPMSEKTKRLLLVSSNLSEKITNTLVDGAFCTNCHIPETLFKVIFWLGYCNSMMNPIIYACSSREFQRAFRRILRCEYKRKPKLLLSKTESRGASSSDLTRSFKNNRQGSLSSPQTNYSANQETVCLDCSSSKSWKSRKAINLGNGCILKRQSNLNSNNKNLQKMKNSEYVKSSSESVDDSETASLSDDQMEALRLERLEIVSSV